MTNNNSNNGFNSHIKNTAKLHWHSKPNIEPEAKNLEFQTAEIIIPNVEKADSTLDKFIEEAAESKVIIEKPNRLVWGDNLLVMQALIAEGYEGKIDLIYVDPPFNTGEEFNFVTEAVLPSGQRFEKEWTMIERLAYTDTWERGIDSYLDMLYVRFQLIRRLLSPEGCIYVHLDPNMGHYVKILLDEVFGNENFKAEISWKKTTKTTSFKNYGSEHDVIYYYVKSNGSYTFNQAFRPLKESELLSKYIYLQKPDGKIITLNKEQREGKKPLPAGRRFRGIPMINMNPDRPNLKYEFLGHTRVWATEKERFQNMYDEGKIFQINGGLPQKKGFLDENLGAKVNDVWDDINPVNSQAIERTGYPTQKPEKLMSRILEVSSKEGDLVADFFGGSGTTAAVAEQLKRRWISTDVSKASIHVTRNRLINLNDKLKGKEKRTMPAREVSPFIVQNLGNYQRHLIYLHGFNIKKACALIMKLYGAIQREDIIDLGTKMDSKSTLVFVSYPDRQLTAKAVFEKASEVEGLDNGIYKKLVVLAWDYEINYDQNFSILKDLQKIQIEIESKLIPVEIYTYLKKVDASREDQINSLRDKIHFYDKPYLKLKKPEIIKDMEKEAIVRIEIDRYNILDFPMKDQDEETKLLRACKNNFSLLIDYYAVDWDYDGQIFRSQTQVMAGFGKDRSVVKKFVEHRLKKGKKYKIVMRLVDIFGNDSEARTEVNLK